MNHPHTLGWHQISWPYLGPACTRVEQPCVDKYEVDARWWYGAHVIGGMWCVWYVVHIRCVCAKRLIYNKVLYSSARRVPRHLAIPSLRLLFPSRKLPSLNFPPTFIALLTSSAGLQRRYYYPQIWALDLAEILVLNEKSFPQMATSCLLTITNQQNLVYVILEQFCMNWIWSIIIKKSLLSSWLSPIIMDGIIYSSIIVNESFDWSAEGTDSEVKSEVGTQRATKVSSYTLYKPFYIQSCFHLVLLQSARPQNFLSSFYCSLAQALLLHACKTVTSSSFESSTEYVKHPDNFATLWKQDLFATHPDS